MAQIWADRVKETSTTTGTGAFTLAGAVDRFQRFSAVCSTSDTMHYAIEGASGTGEWETGLGTYSGTNTLTRTTVIASSNSNAAVSFSAGTKTVVLAPLSADVAYLGVKAYNDGTQSVSNSTDTVITFNTNEFGSSSVHSTSSNTGRFVATVAGKWQFTYHIQWNGNATGQRLVWLRANGTTAVNGSRTALVPNGNNIVNALTMDLSLSASDYVEIVANQSSGGSLNTGIALATDAVYVNMACMRYVGT